MRIILLFLVLFVFACKGTNSNQETTTALPEASQALKFSVEGMICTGCESTIQTNVLQLEGIVSVRAFYTNGNVVVNFDPEKVDTTAIKQSILKSGYTVLSIAPYQK